MSQPAEYDVAPCREYGSHRAERRHAKAFCPVEIEARREENYYAEAEADSTGLAVTPTTVHTETNDTEGGGEA